MVETLSAYEQQRLLNVERNNEHLCALGIVPHSLIEPSMRKPKRARVDYGERIRQSARVAEAPSVEYDETKIYRSLLAANNHEATDADSDSNSSSADEYEDESEDESVDESGPSSRRRARRNYDQQRRPRLRAGGPTTSTDAVAVAKGLRLHLSRRSLTGYKGVALSADAGGLYHAFSPRTTDGQKIYIGSFKTPTEAAIAYAKHVKRCSQGEGGVAGAMATAFESAVAHAEGMDLHLSRQSASGYEGVRVWRPPNRTLPVRYRVIAPMQHAERPATLGYYDTAVEAAVAYAKYIKSPSEWSHWQAERRAKLEAQKRAEGTAVRGARLEQRRGKREMALEVEAAASASMLDAARAPMPAVSSRGVPRPKGRPPNGTNGVPMLWDTHSGQWLAGVRHEADSESAGNHAGKSPIANGAIVGTEEETSRVSIGVGTGAAKEVTAVVVQGADKDDEAAKVAPPRAKRACAASEPPAKTPRGAPGPPAKTAKRQRAISDDGIPGCAGHAVQPPPDAGGTRTFVGVCQRTCGCVREARHRGRCKMGAIAEEEYEVEAILQESMGGDGDVAYLVKWRGWPLDDCTWEAEAALTSCPDVLKAWRAKA